MILSWREFQKGKDDRAKGVYLWTLPTFGFFPFYIGTARGQKGFAGRLNSAPHRFGHGQMSFVRKKHLVPAGREISHRAYMELWRKHAQAPSVHEFMYVPSSIHPQISEDLREEGRFFFDSVRLLVCDLPENQNPKFVECRLLLQLHDYLKDIGGKFDPNLRGSRSQIGGRRDHRAPAWSNEDDLLIHHFGGREYGSTAEFFRLMSRAFEHARAG